MPDLRQGRIVLVEMSDPQGRNPKLRPAIVVSKTGQECETGFLTVVALTTRIDQAPIEFSVRLPWHRDGHPRTQLRQSGVAVCNWFAAISPKEIVEVKGIVPPRELTRILALVEAQRSPIEGESSPPQINERTSTN